MIKAAIVFFICIVPFWATTLTYKENNVVYNITVEEDGSNYILESTYSYTRSFDGKKVLIKFKEVTPENIQYLESRYNFINLNILSTGEFIYTIDTNDIFNICEELSKDNNIITVKPIIDKTVKMY